MPQSAILLFYTLTDMFVRVSLRIIIGDRAAEHAQGFVDLSHVGT